MPLILTETEVEELLDMRSVLDAVEDILRRSGLTVRVLVDDPKRR